MKLLNKISEEEVILEFLLAEISSPRFSNKLNQILIENGWNKEIISKADILDETENKIRKKILSEHRGWGNNTDMFEGFPKDIEWFLAEFDTGDLLSVMYIDYDYWNKLSNDTRFANEAVSNIRNGVEVYEISNNGFIQVSEKVKSGSSFKKLILVAKDEKSRIVAVEGHARLTGFLLAKEYLKFPIQVIIGFSKDIEKWDLY